MLFRKDTEPACALCSHAIPVDEQMVLCKHRGVVDAGFRCRRFKYDATKRVPKPKLKVSGDFDFKIDE